MELPVDILHWLLSILPVVVLAFLLIQLQWTAQQAGALGAFMAAALAIFVFRAPVETVAVAGAKGVWDAIFILLVIWPALFLYKIMDLSGGYEALKQGITGLSRNELFIVVALGWVFASFLQGIDGFGTPIAIVAPLLVAYGVKPVYAVVIPIIGHIWGKFFGTLGAGWLATLQVVNFDEPQVFATALQSALLIAPQTLLGGLTIVWMYGRFAALKQGLPLVLIIAVIQGGGQILAVWIDPTLATFLPATAALFALYPLSRWKRYSEPVEGIKERPAMKESSGELTQDLKPPMGTGMAFLPYILLSVLAVSTSIIEPLRAALHQFSVGLPFPEVSTGYGVSEAATDSYSPLHLFTHPGAGLLLTAFITLIVFQARGYFSQWRQTADTSESLWSGLFKVATPASVPLITFLMMASLMNHAGLNQVLALGISNVAPAYVFAFLSNGIGVIGAFTTSSSTSSNVLFSELQVTIARLKELSEATILAAQSAGGAIGNAVAPANVIMGASTTGISGKEGEIMRKTLPWTVVTFLLTGVLTVLLVVFGA